MWAFWKLFSVVLLGVVLTNCGQVLVSKCLRDRKSTTSGDPTLRQWERLCEALHDRRAAVGVVCMIIALPLGLLALAMADISVAVPLGAISYILAAFMGAFYLGEHVGPLRWIGTLLIIFGTILVGLSASHTGSTTQP
ncbi:MAG TPA: EamA family transporter [Pirellulales bacterium]|nr:EamA family transporter [Pirellulales bacterium]